MIVYCSLPVERCLAVLCFSAVAKKGEIGFETGWSNSAIKSGLIDSTSRFARMGAVGIATVGTNTKYLPEIMPNFLFLHINSAETFDTRGINEPTAGLPRPPQRGGHQIGCYFFCVSFLHCALCIMHYASCQRVHFGESGGMSALVVSVGDSPRTGEFPPENSIQERRFPDPRIATEKRNLAIEKGLLELLYLVRTDSLGREGIRRVTK